MPEAFGQNPEQKACIRSSTSTRAVVWEWVEVELWTRAFCSGFCLKASDCTAGSLDLD